MDYLLFQLDETGSEPQDTCMGRVMLIAHNLRSCHNVGSLLRTADGLGIEKVYLTGYTPYPLSGHDDRMPHLARKIDAQIHKTALDAEKYVDWEHQEDVLQVIQELRRDGWQVVALEQSERSVPLPELHLQTKVALLVGREVEGVEHEVLAVCDLITEIPMHGSKESFNVATAAAMGLYQLTEVVKPLTTGSSSL